MKPLLSRSLAVLVTLTASLAPAPSARAEADTVPLTRAIAAVVEAFQAADAGELRAALAKDKKVYLAIPAVHDKDGFYGADQAFYLFQTFFEQHATRSFTIATEEIEANGGTAFARAQWRYQDAHDTSRAEPLVFTFAEERGRWVITEIRSARS